MDPLPAGTVTMLFTDIEGSTLLLSRLGERYGEAPSRQRRIMPAAIAAWSGREMGTEGDSFFVVFESALHALSACLQAQRALPATAWPDGGQVVVSGVTGQLVGLALHFRAARLTGAADRLRDWAGIPRPPPGARHLARFLGPARAALGDRVWNAEYVTGQQMSRAQVLALATARHEPHPDEMPEQHFSA